MSEIFAVYDQAAHRFLEMFCQVTVDSAIRSFKQAVQTPEHQFAKFPEDYVLYHIGSYDPDKGSIEAFDARKIAMALDYSGGFGNQLELEAGA